MDWKIHCCLVDGNCLASLLDKSYLINYIYRMKDAANLSVLAHVIYNFNSAQSQSLEKMLGVRMQDLGNIYEIYMKTKMLRVKF